MGVGALRVAGECPAELPRFTKRGYYTGIPDAGLSLSALSHKSSGVVGRGLYY